MWRNSQCALVLIHTLSVPVMLLAQGQTGILERPPSQAVHAGTGPWGPGAGLGEEATGTPDRMACGGLAVEGTMARDARRRTKGREELQGKRDGAQGERRELSARRGRHCLRHGPVQGALVFRIDL